MQTGGLGLTDRRIKRLNRLDYEVSVFPLMVQRMHMTHYETVGSFKAGMAAIKRASITVLQSHPIPKSINSPKDRLFRNWVDILETAGVQIWRSQITVPMGRTADRPEWLLQPYEVVEVIDTLAEAKQKF